MRARVLPLLLLAAAACAPAARFDPVPLRLVRDDLVRADAAERVRHLRFLDPRGDSVSAYLRGPAGPEGPAWGVVIVAGRETGQQAAAVVPGPLEGWVLAVEYPAAVPEAMEGWTTVRKLPEVRRTALRVPGVLRGAARWLAALPEVDSARVALIGVSFGVPFAAAAASDPVFSAVALHHGGADLALLFRTNLALPRLVRAPAAWLGARYFRALEPARHVGAVSPTPLLLVNGLHDEMVPRRSAERLAAAARPPVRHVWLPHGHLEPGDTAAMRELADSTLAHFPVLRGGPRAPR